MTQAEAPVQKRELKERFKDKEYMNWQRACQALVMLKEFLEPLIEELARHLHDIIKTKAAPTKLTVCSHRKDTHTIKRIFRRRQDPAQPKEPRATRKLSDDIFSFPPDSESDVNDEGALDIEAALADESEEEGAAVRRR